MKKNFLSLPAVLAVALLSACGGNETPANDTATNDTTATEPVEEVCLYHYDNSTTTVLWTAYKHNAKVEVKGKLETFEVTTGEPSEDLATMVQGTTFKIYADTGVNSEDPVRDKKIMEIFFGAMSTQEITGTINSMNGDNESGSGTLTLSMNGVDKEVNFDYTVDENNRMELAIAEINMHDWNGQEACDALHKACEEKHTGDDGESVFWPTMAVNIFTTYTVECN